MLPKHALRIGRRAALISPLCASLLLLAIPHDPDAIIVFFNRYVSLILIFALWSLALELIDRYSALPNRPEHKRRRTLLLGAIVVTAIASLALLNYVKFRYELPIFYLTIIILGQRGLAIFLRQKKLLAAALMVQFTLDFALAFLSFQMAIFHLHWQILVFSVAIAAMLGAVRWADLFTTSQATAAHALKPDKGSGLPALLRRIAIDAQQREVVLRKAYMIMLFLGPVLIGLMSLMGQLTLIYIAVYLLLPIMGNLVQEAASAPVLTGVPPRFFSDTLAVYLTFLLILLGCSLLLL